MRFKPLAFGTGLMVGSMVALPPYPHGPIWLLIACAITLFTGFCFVLYGVYVALKTAREL